MLRLQLVVQRQAPALAASAHDLQHGPRTPARTRNACIKTIADDCCSTPLLGQTCQVCSLALLIE